LDTGEILVKQGEYFRFFCVVLTGKIDAIYENDKISNRLFVFESGDYFGELPLMLDIPYPTTMRTAEPSLIFLIPQECFQILLHQYPHLADHVAEALATRQDTLERHKQKLQELGLCNDNDFNHPIVWIRQRLSQIFGLIHSES
ncbi:MAG: cyclic nucleotide-binding domain-containing protein, partial [Microcystaceae cyanobacterium]